MITRRATLAGLGLLVPALAAAQTRPRRLGVLRPGSRPPDDDIQITGLHQALANLGHEVGRSLIIDYRYADGAVERLPELARSLIKDGADVLLTVGASATLAARETTKTVPIIMFANIDPVRIGLADSLQRPKENITGVLIAPDGSLAAKRLALLKEASPTARSIALLAVRNDPTFALQIKETEAAAKAAGVALTVVPDHGSDYRTSFSNIAAAGGEALIVGSHQFFVRDRRTIIALAAEFRLPAIYEWREQVADGGMMSFGASLTERQQRVASYVDRVLKGAEPRELPFEQPAALGLSINMRTVRALGLQLPESFLARADEVIE